MVVFAKSGSGKSYAIKLEILRYLMQGVDCIVIDPENEYQFEGNMVYEIPMKNWVDRFDDGGPIDPRRVTTNA
jgi:hypothetical protein